MRTSYVCGRRWRRCSVTDLRADLTVFMQLLRVAGVDVGAEQAITFVQAVKELSPNLTREDLHWAGRTTLVAHHEDQGIYDAVFGAWFLDLTPDALGTESTQEQQLNTSNDEQAGAPADELPDTDSAATTSAAQSSKKVARGPRTPEPTDAEPHIEPAATGA